MSTTDTRLRSLDQTLDTVWSQTRSRADQGIIGRVVDAVRRAPDPSDLDTLSTDLFAVVDAFGSSAALRRALTDPGADEEQRQRLAHSLLDGKVSKTAVGLVADAVGMRWSSGRALVDALERQAVRAEIMSADDAGNLDETEDELFRFARLVESTPTLRDAFADRSVPVGVRQDLVGDLLAERATRSTTTLAKRAVAARERTFAHTLEGYISLAAAQKNRVVATVRVARPLDPDQRQRLQAALQRQVGRDVALQEVVDPQVLGGVRVELGDEVVEGTVEGRLEAARRMFG